MRPEGVGILQLEATREIDAEMADVVSRYAAAFPGHSIEIAVDTEGGDWAASLAIFGSLKRHRRRVTARIQRASSGGALIIMAADLRILAPTGFIFLHRAQGDYPAATLDKITDQKAALMASRCRVPADRIRRWMDANTTIRAERALEYGLVDEVPGRTKPTRPVVFL